MYSEVKLINIILVRRGKCTFTTKVKVANKKGAHAVIIVDSKELTRKDLDRTIVADDGYGEAIRIPSILITKLDGEPLIEAVKTNHEPVIVELSWEVPTDHVVAVDLWMNSASQESLKFLKDFSRNRLILNEVVTFQPHFAVFGMPGSTPQVYNDLCSDTAGEYCAEDPDGGGEVTGKQVLDEDVRMLCIHELYKSPHASQHEVARGNVVAYAAEFWHYVGILLDRCPLDGKSGAARYGKECSEKVMKESKIDVLKVNECMLRTKDEKLNFEREHPAWSPRALRINGWRYSGMLDADLVTRAICAAFVTQPSECVTLLSPRNPTIPFDPNAGASQVSYPVFLVILSILIGIGVMSAYLYKKNLKHSVRTHLREEVMLEVQAQMGEYSRLAGNS